MEALKRRTLQGRFLRLRVPKGGNEEMIPKDPVMLLSYVNTQLRDFYPSLDAFCEDKELNAAEVCGKLRSIDYEYDGRRNQFV